MARFGYQVAGFGAYASRVPPESFITLGTSGGSEATDGDFKVRTFTSNGDFVIGDPVNIRFIWDTFPSAKMFFVRFADRFFIVVDSSNVTKFNLFLVRYCAQA